jgi:Stage III sporulation protein AC/AD protein family.
MDVLRIGMLGIAGVMLALQFKSNRPEYGLYIGFAVSLMIFTFIVSGLASLFGSMGIMETYIGSDRTYFAILLKVIGITYICEFCSGICRDAGYASVSGQIEIFGKLSVLAAGMPILLAIIESIQEIAG